MVLVPSSPKVLRPQLSICSFLFAETVAASLSQFLGGDRYVVTHYQSLEPFFNYVKLKNQHLDCLIFQAHPALKPLAQRLARESILLPAVILYLDESDEVPLPPPEVSSTGSLTEDPSLFRGRGVESISEQGASHSNGEVETAYLSANLQRSDPSLFYHTAEEHLTGAQLSQIATYVEQAIAQFLNLSPSCLLTDEGATADPTTNSPTQNLLLLQQRRVAEKLKERLGYLGVYYKRNPQLFFRNLPRAEREKFLAKLKADYGEIILNYFSQDINLNQKIDDFVNIAFFADIAVTQIVEIHMELMDDFSKQLKMEGRSEEILLDYRLTLIDTLAHLCEMYRRSIPRDT